MKDRVAEFVETIVRSAGFDLDVHVEEPAPEELRVNLTGPDRGLVLGRGAELLEALEYITNRAFSKSIDRDGHIVFDSGNYRALRAEELRLMALKAAERVRGQRSPFVFEPMAPSERRIIHLALVDDRSVRTESVGAGADRKVRIVPA